MQQSLRDMDDILCQLCRLGQQSRRLIRLCCGTALRQQRTGKQSAAHLRHGPCPQAQGGRSIKAEHRITNRQIRTLLQGSGKVHQRRAHALHILCSHQHTGHIRGQLSFQAGDQARLAMELLVQRMGQGSVPPRRINQKIGALGIGIDLCLQLLALQLAVTAVH